MATARLPLHSLLLAFGLGVTGVARAEAPSSEAAVEARRDQAKVEFQRGSDLYGSEHYAEAVTAFITADRLAPSAVLSFNIARAYEHLNDTSGALRWYRDYLRRSPTAKNAAEVKARIAELSAKLSRGGLQQLTVLSMPVGAVVVVDGRAVGVTPFTGDLALGKHRVQLNLKGYADPGNEVALSPIEARDLQVELRPDAERSALASPSVAPTPIFPDRYGSRRFGFAPWIIAGTGVAGLGSALGFELARHSNENAARTAGTPQLDFKAKTDAMTRDQTTARVLGGVGGALLVTGVVMLVFNDRTHAAPRVGLSCDFHGCSASARGTF